MHIYVWRQAKQQPKREIERVTVEKLEHPVATIFTIF